MAGLDGLVRLWLNHGFRDHNTKVKQQPEEEPVSAPESDAAHVAQKTEKAKNALKVKNAVVVDDEDELYGLGKPQKEEEKKIDEATMREMRKQEEIAKAKLAMERKKKQAEKAAAKAAKRAQMEADKREKKEREKKAKKNFDAEAEVPEVSDAEKEETEAQVEEKLQKEKVLKEKPIRNRIRSRGGPETLPRAILKRKKSINYWVWAAPTALVVLMLLVLDYYYAL